MELTRAAMAGNSSRRRKTLVTHPGRWRSICLAGKASWGWKTLITHPGRLRSISPGMAGKASRRWLIDFLIDEKLGEKQWMWRHLRPERATTSFQMTVPINLPMRGSALFAPYTSVSEPCIVVTKQIGNPWRCLECGFPLLCRRRAVITDLCISAANRISSSGSSL
jgi:hypothetical protein